MEIGKLSRILVAIDGSENSMDAADYGISLAKADNAELIVIYTYSIIRCMVLYDLSTRSNYLAVVVPIPFLWIYSFCNTRRSTRLRGNGKLVSIPLITRGIVWTLKQAQKRDRIPSSLSDVRFVQLFLV